jgi:hypothetical protein
MNSKILLILLFFCASFYQSAAQAPPNDDCTGATAITTVPFGTACSTSVSISTLNATASTPGTSCVASPDDDIWFQFTASSSSVIFRYANARNAANGNQTSPSLALYQSNCPINTTTFFCQAVTVSGDGFRIINGLTPGATYYLRIWSLSVGIVMNIDFCIQNVNAAPANDECANAQAIATLPPGSSCTSPLFATTVGATQSTPAPSCSGSSHNDDIWYSFVANTSAVSIQFSNARLTTTNGNANLGYAVYNSACPTTTATMFCNGNLGGTSGSVTVNGLVPGNTYFIRFFSLGDNNYMTFQFCVIDIIVAQNDECANAILFQTYDLNEIATELRISTGSATRSPNDPDCSGGENNDDVWYRFTASTSSIIIKLKNVVVNETGGGGTAGYALYAGACPTTAVTFSCNTIASAGGGEHIVNGLTPGTEYYLRLWSTLGGGNTVSFDLTVLNVPSSSNDECINAIPIATQATDSSCNSTIHASTAGATQSSPDPSCSNGFNDEDIWYSFVAVTNAVRVNLSNAARISGSGSSTLGFALHSGSCATLPITAGCQSNIGTGNGTVLVGGLTPGQTYLLRFYSYDVNNYIQFDFCVVDAELPENDECNNATTILSGSGFCTSPVIGRLRNATTSAGFGAASCAPSATTQDVWFRTNIPGSGNLIIQTSSINNSGIEDLVMEAYIGSCGSLTLIACNDDGNPDPAANEFHPRISLTGRTAGEQIYLRVMKKYPVTYNEFGICAWDSTVLIPIAQGGNCVPAEPITISAANGNNWMWVPIMDASKHIIAEINARGSNLGTVSGNLFVNSSGTVRNLNGHFYLDRNVSIDPQTSGPAWIRLYIRNIELQSLMTADASITGIANLKITKTDAACGPAFAGTATIIQQDTSGSYGADHFIEFPVQSFSSFFVDGGVAALPLEFVSFKVEKQNDHINLNWVVVQDAAIARFELQRSNDGVSFTGIGEKDPRAYISDNNNNWQYNFRDDNPAATTVFYRVKMIDENGKQVYSKVVGLTATGDNGPVSIYPNPVSRYLIVRMPMSVTSAGLRLFNGSGALVKQLSGQPISNGVYTLDMQYQPAGMYFLHVNTGRNWHQLKVIKR